MNQILAVELPKNRNNIKKGPRNKASIKSVVIFFCIVSALFGIALIGVSIFSMIRSNTNQDNSKPTDLPKIHVSQNSTELEIEIICSSEISKIEYNWEEKETETINGNGKSSMSLNNIDIPSGNNIFNITVTDVDGRQNTYSKEYVGAKEPKITVFDPSQKENKIIVKCEENQIIKYMSYYYDDEQEQKVDINNTSGIIEIDVKEGEHNLTIKALYEDGTEGKIKNKVFAPTIDIATNGSTQYNKFIINVSDERGLSKIKINFNGKDTEEQIDSKTYTKEIDLQPGEPGTNKLIITAYNKEGMPITKRVWDKNRQK